MKFIFVFKTSVATKTEVSKLKPGLNKLMQTGDRWNFDLEDCDHILRVESTVNKTDNIKDVLQVAGFDCEELK